MKLSPWIHPAAVPMPDDGREFLVLHIAAPFPGLHIVRWEGQRWCHRSPYNKWGYHPKFLAAEGLSFWAPIDTIPSPGDTPPDGWATMESAPRDGTPFLRLAWTQVIGRLGNHYEPHLHWLWRSRLSPDSDGCWMHPASSIGDDYVRHGFWTRDALPVCILPRRRP